MHPNEAVVAGSSEFIDALLPLVQERLGGAPRTADTPALAAALCQGGVGLLVYEHGGREWLSVCDAIRAVRGSEMIVVAALPPEFASDVAEISSAVSAVVAWRGEGKPVIDAVARVMAAREAPTASARHTSPIPTPPAVTPPVAPVAPPPVASVVAPPPVAPAAPEEIAMDSIFEGEGMTGASPLPGPPAGMAPPAGTILSGTWPATVLSAEEGLSVVKGALSGLWPEQRLRSITESVVASLSAAEKAAALGQPFPVDAAPMRRAVGLRWQVAAAIQTLPPVGSPVDQRAVQEILEGIDQVLAELRTGSDDSVPEALRSVEAVRHALVREAIDLTEALQKVAPADVVVEITTSRKAHRPQPTPAPRPVQPVVVAEAPSRQVPWGLVIVLVAAVVGATAYHGYRYVNRPGSPISPIAGAPSGTLGAIGLEEKLVVSPGGKSVDPRELENFRNLQKTRGAEVREILPGTFVVAPAPRASP